MGPSLAQEGRFAEAQGTETLPSPGPAQPSLSLNKPATPVAQVLLLGLAIMEIKG